MATLCSKQYKHVITDHYIYSVRLKNACVFIHCTYIGKHVNTACVCKACIHEWEYWWRKLAEHDAEKLKRKWAIVSEPKITKQLPLSWIKWVSFLEVSTHEGGGTDFTLYWVYWKFARDQGIKLGHLAVCFYDCQIKNPPITSYYCINGNPLLNSHI